MSCVSSANVWVGVLMLLAALPPTAGADELATSGIGRDTRAGLVLSRGQDPPFIPVFLDEALHARVGMILSPRAGFADSIGFFLGGDMGGLRLDADVVPDSGVRGRAALLTGTLSVVAGRAIPADRLDDRGCYAGAGSGVYSAGRTHLGGKMLAGTGVRGVGALETGLHLVGSGDAFVTLHLRVAPGR